MPAAFDAARDYEITFWAKNDTNIRQTEIYKQAIADFEALYPNITVTLRLYTDYGDIYNDVITNIATGTTPNVCITYPDHIATYLTGNNQQEGQSPENNKRRLQARCGLRNLFFHSNYII